MDEFTCKLMTRIGRATIEIENRIIGVSLFELELLAQGLGTPVGRIIEPG